MNYDAAILQMLRDIKDTLEDIRRRLTNIEDIEPADDTKWYPIELEDQHAE